MNDTLNFRLDDFTFYCCLFIFIVFTISLIYIIKLSGNDYKKNKKKINQIPTLISTLGVLGTFLGITKGLLSFDTDDLNTSIPLLLNGLKTAFFTSLEGMFGSLILNGMLSKKLDKYENISESEKAANLIIKELQENRKQQSLNMSKLTECITDNKIIQKISIDLEQLKDDVEEIKGHIEESKSIIEEIKGKSESISNIVHESANSTSEENSRLRAVLLTATAAISSIDNTLETMSEKVSKIDDKIDTDNND